MKRKLSAVAAVVLGLIVFGPAARAKDVVRVAEGPFISGGAFYIARDKGYFDKLNLTIETKYFDDGALAVPSLIAGELDIATLPAAANLFNSIAKGAPIVVILDRGRNTPERGYTVGNVTQALYDQGIHGIADFAKLKGKRIGVSALGSINQYNMALELAKAGLDPATDVQWTINVAQPDLMKMLGQNQLDFVNIAYQFGVFAQNNKWGPIVANDGEALPGGQVATYAARKDFLAQHRDVAIRFVMAYLQGIKEFDQAAGDPAHHADIVAILAKDTALNKPELVTAIAPHWSYVAEDGMPNVQSIMQMQDFWAGKAFHFVETKVPESKIFDLSIVKEAKARFDKEKPFGP